MDSPPFVNRLFDTSTGHEQSRSSRGEAAADVEEGAVSEHRAGEGEEAIGDGPECAAMCLSSGSEGSVGGSTLWVVLRGDSGPVVQGVAKAKAASLSHDDNRPGTGSLAAISRDRCDTTERAKSLVVSRGKGLRGLREQRGENNPSDSRQGTQDVHVTLLALLPRRGFLLSELGGEGVEPTMRLLELSIIQAEALG